MVGTSDRLASIRARIECGLRWIAQARGYRASWKGNMARNRASPWAILVVIATTGIIVAIVWALSRRSPGGEVAANGIASHEYASRDFYGNTLEVDPIIPTNLLETYEQQARAGDNERANRLAAHFRALGQSGPRRRWLTLAANRGDCAAIAELRGDATNDGNRARASHLNELLRRHVCTWGKAYGAGAAGDPAVDAMPLWENGIVANNER
jgi:hypothetical protein